MKYHLCKKSRMYHGYPYCGPTSGGENAETDNLDDAIKMQALMTRNNPVGWDIFNSVTKEKIQ